MRIRSGFLILALLPNLFVAGAFDARSAYACSCATVSLEKQIKTSDAVFSGEVVGIEPDELAPVSGPPSLGRVTFDVKDRWKGASGDPVVVYGHGPEASCGIEFEESKSYLVYAYRSNGDGEDPLQTNLCNSTKPLEHADGDLLVLAEGPLPGTGGYVFSEDAATLTAICALLALVGALVLLRRIRRPL